MYESFYHLKENPFRLSPDPGFMCMTAQHQEALSGLIYSIRTRPGLTVLLGEAGTGKTTLLYSLLGLLEKRRFVTVLCNNPTLTRQEFYDLLLLKFGVECSSNLKSRQLQALEAALTQNRADGRPSLLIVDEAQRLSPELLEEIRLLLNLETPREKLLEIIIAGQPELGDMLRRPELRQLKQRVSTICRLKPLSPEELQEYLHHRIAHAGLPSQNLFADSLVHLIHEYTGGIPRLVNGLCDAALQTGFALQSSRITAAILDEVARDLELVRPATEEEPPPAPVPAAVAPAAADVAIRHLTNGKPANGHANGNGTLHGTNGTDHKPVEPRMPLESYSSRQKSVSFFTGFMDRWK